MEREEIYQLILRKVNNCFSPSKEELELIKHRLSLFNNEELQHLEANFAYFGVDVIVECLYKMKFGEM